ncbi:hypothetical protein QYE76_054148 [Lolium multiflorum]|uniref:Retrotransposon protein n=1 Tax=Lolium multiflorum TaxID=4521 RepID=A0AAD8SXQ5_LOLMU|nr:hypothetical protein QYE76_054148 [Lolium multiflorum]
MNKISYASAVGSIMYAMLCTRPNIAHVVSLTSRYQSDPGMEHWTTVKNILKYLKRTKDMFLCYGGDQELVVTSYTDASWNTDPDDSKSQSGYVFVLNGAAVSWSSSKQCTVAKSSTESEYIAASEASSVWMKRFIIELGVVPSALDPLVIYCDNMGAIANAQEPRSHKKLQHIKLRFHSIREYMKDDKGKNLFSFATPSLPVVAPWGRVRKRHGASTLEASSHVLFARPSSDDPALEARFGFRRHVFSIFRGRVETCAAPRLDKEMEATDTRHIEEIYRSSRRTYATNSELPPESIANTCRLQENITHLRHDLDEIVGCANLYKQEVNDLRVERNMLRLEINKLSKLQEENIATMERDKTSIQDLRE